MAKRLSSAIVIAISSLLLVITLDLPPPMFYPVLGMDVAIHPHVREHIHQCADNPAKLLLYS
ncbi:hypothetical protein AAULR_25546 [Lacticaseibacillus rhamnosus MTCC 5462]|nr:hypothetical protein AAULR_25546 [Lacticaseibacillus rhamnosus MTCC 5462]